MVGTAAALANAIYNATSKSVRDLPVTIDKLLSLLQYEHLGATVGHSDAT